MEQENSTTQQQQMAEEVAEQQQIVAHKDSTKQIAEEVDEEQQQRLKYLQFVQVVAVHTAICFTNAYGYAKEKSGPLRTGVESMEGAVKTVVGPVYDKYNAVPANLLAVADRKVDESVTKLAASQAMCAAKKAPETARSMYSKYEPKAEKCAVCAWRKLNELPGMPKVAEVVVPTAAYCSEKYNHAVRCTAEKGYKLATYMPLVPMEKFAKAHCA